MDFKDMPPGDPFAAQGGKPAAASLTIQSVGVAFVGTLGNVATEYANTGTVSSGSWVPVFFAAFALFGGIKGRLRAKEPIKGLFK